MTKVIDLVNELPPSDREKFEAYLDEIFPFREIEPVEEIDLAIALDDFCQQNWTSQWDWLYQISCRLRTECGLKRR